MVTLTSSVVAKLATPLIGVVTVSEIAGIDINTLPGLGIIGTAMIFAWRLNHRSKLEALEDARSITAGYKQIVSELRDENRALREELLKFTNQGDNEDE